jgi:hypothetical protein
MRNLKHLKQRISWMATFLATCQPNNPMQILEEFIMDLSPRKCPEDERMNYILRRIEFLLRYIHYSD